MNWEGWKKAGYKEQGRFTLLEAALGFWLLLDSCGGVAQHSFFKLASLALSVLKMLLPFFLSFSS